MSDFNMKILLLFLFLDGLGKSMAQGSSLSEIDPTNIYSDSIKRLMKYYLYTPKNPEKYQVLNQYDPKSIKRTNFDANKPTKFIIPGFLADYQHELVQLIKGRYVTYDDVNVIAVDWSGTALILLYFLPVVMAPDVGRSVAAFIDSLVYEGLIKLGDIHIIGHSLGAHVAGTAGYYMTSGKVARVTGLDAVRIGFDLVGPGTRLDIEDAVFVDCMITAGSVVNFKRPPCTVRFYVNGGLEPQPGCLNTPISGCSHSRAYFYFAESIIPSHKFPAVSCLETPIQIDVSNFTFLMGEPASARMSGDYCVATNSKFPFATIVDKSK